MKTFVNIGPSRSGTTSTYEILKQHPDVDVGLTKEPMYLGYDLVEYLSICNLNKKVFIDGSPNLIYKDINIKQELKHYFNDFKFICILRNPKLYITSKFFVSYIYSNRSTEHFDLNDLIRNHKFSFKKFKNNIKNEKYKWYKNIDIYLYSNILKRAEVQYGLNNILITSIDSSSFIDDIFNFLNLKISSNIKKVEFNKTMNNIKDIDSMGIYCKIKKEVFSCTKINKILKNDFQYIDKTYNTKFSDFYKDVFFK